MSGYLSFILKFKEIEIQDMNSLTLIQKTFRNWLNCPFFHIV